MSYILDALRRAEAERERGNVPGLHTQPVAAPAANASARRWPPLLWWGTGGLALLLLLATVAWLLLTRPAAVPTPVAAPAPAPVVAPRAPPPVVTAATPVTPAEALQVVPVAPAPAPAPASAAAPAPRPSPAASMAAAPPPSITPWERLPEAQRRQLPTLAISGAIWSESAANRMLIVSGQLLHEGEAVAPGVVLEQIRPKSAVLRRGELRYEVSF